MSTTVLCSVAEISLRTPIFNVIGETGSFGYHFSLPNVRQALLLYSFPLTPFLLLAGAAIFVSSQLTTISLLSLRKP